jgi:DNA polymerase III subunit beta
MKVICEKEELLKGSQIVQTVVSPKSTLPILSNFLFETENQKLKLSSTNLEVGVSCYVKGEIVKEGSITVPAKRFADIIKELPSTDNIEIKADDVNQIDLKCGKSKFVLMGLPKSDYPVLPDFPEEKTFNIPKDTLSNMFRKTSFSVSNDETRYVLNGIYLIVEGGLLKFVATDGRRLAVITRDGIDKKMNQKVIIPIKAVNEVQRILAVSEGQEEVKVGIAQNQIAFKIGSITLISRLIDGTYPSYEQVIPKKYDVQIKLNVKNTLSAVRQMAILTSEKASVVKFIFGKNVLRMTAQSQGFGSGEVEMDIEHAGPNIEIAFNPMFLIDILKNIDEDEVNFELTSALNPALIVPLKDKQYQSVVMPMRI